ncbi:TerD family protein [Actinokineospora auranticolor]|uniref:Uncharacterized protein n=1 Tax=Actinokineospora auranticolor TaxID=155976 RepID=A0A2S6H1K2_9PSEU|nr:TerD family protein [Actinokineospora auranticolor]PPK71311.1 hypothetical protein CLV40_101500 [Actinokineospora auranticolor]
MRTQAIIRRTLRVPRVDGEPGDGAAVARQLDIALVKVGFTAARDLLEHVSGLAPAAATGLAREVVDAVRELVGAHVEHNSYFINFPNRVPDTVEFWAKCLREALAPAERGRWRKRVPTDDELRARLGAGVDLLSLPRYGRYQHTFAELLAAHDELVALGAERITVVHLGDSLDAETSALYVALAGSTTPLGEVDLELLAELARLCPSTELPDVPVRENKAVINAVRLAGGRPLIGVDTVADVLRVACQASGGDVTLQQTSRFRRFRRPERRVLMAALNSVTGGKLGDVARHREPLKRLGEGLHPHEYPAYPHAQEVFAVARGERTVRSLAARAELAFAAGDVVRAAEVLGSAPAMFMRSLDRLLRSCATESEVDSVADVAALVLDSVSGRVLCSVREHLATRTGTGGARVFPTRSRRAWVTQDTRDPLPRAAVDRITSLIDAELIDRLPAYEHLVVDPAVLDVAIPLSGKATEDGFAVLPRGSRTRVDGSVLRMFTYWRQTRERTDFDLGALLLDDHFGYLGHVSWTNTKDGLITYSGDVTEAPSGATEFIDIPLGSVSAAHIVPQVSVYAGEGFDEVAESMFGWMTREPAQRGAPFEPRTVRTRSGMRGAGRVALPVMFSRDASGAWTATWLHLYLNGSPTFRQLESNRMSTALLVRNLLRRRYFTIGYLVTLLRAKAGKVTLWRDQDRFDAPVVFLGLHRPDGLPAGSTAITTENLNLLVPR